MKLSPDNKIKQIIEENPDVWRTTPSFFSWVRGGIRRGLWEKHPVKLKYKNKHRRQITNPNPKGKKPTVWGGTCDICQNEFIESLLQVDHIHGGAFTLKAFDDISIFIENISLVTESDLRLVCKDCNYTLSYAQKYNVSLDEAYIRRFVASIEKDKKLKEFFIGRKLKYPGSIPKAKLEAIEILKQELKTTES